MKSFRPKDGSGEPPAPGRNGERDFKGEKRSNETHRSTTDGDARLFRKGDGQASRLCFIGHVLMENRNGLAVGGVLTRAAGAAEPLAALHLAEALPPGHKTSGRRQGLRQPRIRHGAARARRHPARRPERLRTSGPPAARRSTAARRAMRATRSARRSANGSRKIFGWLKSVGGCRQTRFRGLERVGMAFTFALAAYNLIRIPKLLAGAHELRNACRRAAPLTRHRAPRPAKPPPPARQAWLNATNRPRQSRRKLPQRRNQRLFPQPVKAWPPRPATPIHSGLQNFRLMIVAGSV